MTAFDNNHLSSVDVGDRLRKLREERGMSMRALAQRSGLSANALSVIERNLTSPSVSTLYKLADALEVPITAFFESRISRSKVVFVRSTSRRRVPFQFGIWEGLGGEQFAGRVEPFTLTVAGRGGSGPDSIVHTGHEFVYCLSGSIEYHVEDAIYRLNTGDSLLFSAQLRHTWCNPGEAEAILLIVMSDFKEGEQPIGMHISQAENA